MKQITIAEAIQRTVEHREVFHDEMLHVMRQIMRGELTPAQIAGFIVGLRVKKESIGEIAAAAQVMRELATHVEVKDTKYLVDTCGTGGDSAHTFNVSTCSAIVAAAAGARVAKHMGRSVSSSSGSAEVLEALGANIGLTPPQTGQAIDKLGLGFMFAPAHHSAMKHAAPVRKELGVRTLFNILGPLTNPAGAPNVLMGVFHADLVGIQARVLQQLGASRALVVHGTDGMDEVSLCAPTLVAELDAGGGLREYVLDPAQFGLEPCTAADLRVDDAAQSRDRILEALADAPGPARDIVALNAGAALYAAGVTLSIGDGLELARDMLANGAARAKCDEFVAATRKLAAA